MNSEHEVVEIDPNKLDRECIRLPGDYLKFAHVAAEAKRAADEASNRLALVKAELDRRIRTNPEEFGIEKLTETAVTSAIITSPKYQRAEEAVRTAKHTQEMNQAVVWALETKKRSLTLLVDLHGMGYFSQVPLTAQSKAAVEEMTKQRVRRRPIEE